MWVSFGAPGNAVPFDETVKALTGHSLTADALADACTLTQDQAVAAARASAKSGTARPPAAGPIALDAAIHVIHGNTTIASTDNGGVEGLCEAFESWVGRLEREAKTEVGG